MLGVVPFLEGTDLLATGFWRFAFGDRILVVEFYIWIFSQITGFEKLDPMIFKDLLF